MAGIAIPGPSSITKWKRLELWQVQVLFHDVKEVKAGNAPLTLQAWGHRSSWTKVQKGRLMIPSSLFEHQP